MSDPITTKVRKMRPKRYTAADAAELVGRSPYTIRRWRMLGECMPSDSVKFGSTVVYLYTADDIKALKRFAKAQRPGPKKKEAHATQEAAKRRPTKAVAKKRRAAAR